MQAEIGILRLYLENMDSFLSFLSRLGCQADRENESEDRSTHVERDTPENSQKTDIQGTVLREQPVPTGLVEKTIQTAMPGNEDNTDHIQPTVVVKQKASIETSDECDVGPGEIVTSVARVGTAADPDTILNIAAKSRLSWAAGGPLSAVPRSGLPRSLTKFLIPRQRYQHHRRGRRLRFLLLLVSQVVLVHSRRLPTRLPSFLQQFLPQELLYPAGLNLPLRPLPYLHLLVPIVRTRSMPNPVLVT